MKTSNRADKRITVYVNADTFEKLMARQAQLAKEGYLPSVSALAAAALRRGLSEARQ